MFYRLAFLPNSVVFQNESVSQPHLLVFTKYDPYFLLINLLIAGSIPTSTLPVHFSHLDLELISDKKNDKNDHLVYAYS